MRRATLVSWLVTVPANAQGEGAVVIHHSTGLIAGAFAAVATYDVLSTPGTLGFPATLSFAADGAPVMTPQ